MAKRKVSIEEEARTALQEEKEINAENATVVETDSELVYSSPEEPADNPFAAYQLQMEAAGMTWDDDPEQKVDEIALEDPLKFPKLEDLDTSELPEEDTPSGNINMAEWTQSISAEEFFLDDMDAEEIADWYLYLAEEGEHPFIQTPDGDEIEVVPAEEEPQHKEDPKLSKDDQQTAVSIYLNGKEISKEEFVAEIHKHKEMYLAVLREQYPKVQTMIEKDTARQDMFLKRFEAQNKSKEEREAQKEREVKKERRPKHTKEEQTVIKALKKEKSSGQELQTPAKAAKKRLTDIEEKLKRGEEKVMKKDEVLYAKNMILVPAQNATAIEVNITNATGEIAHNAKLSRGKDGRMYFQLDGRRSSEEEVKKIVEKYPGQLKAAVDFRLKTMERNERGL